MKNISAIVTLCSCIVLQACDSNHSSSSANMMIELPAFTKTVDASNIVADVYNGTGFVSRVEFSDASPRTIPLTNIAADRNYSISIDWFEIIDGVELQLSRQTDNFTPTLNNPNININSEHNTNFTNDNDLTKNIDERKNGTCPWIACTQDGFLIDPLSVATITLSNNKAGLVYEGDRRWASTLENKLRVLSTTRTSILLESDVFCVTCDPFRGVKILLDFSIGEVRVNNNESDADTEFSFEANMTGVELQ